MGDSEFSYYFCVDNSRFTPLHQFFHCGYFSTVQYFSCPDAMPAAFLYLACSGVYYFLPATCVLMRLSPRPFISMAFTCYVYLPLPANHHRMHSVLCAELCRRAIVIFPITDLTIFLFIGRNILSILFSYLCFLS